MVNTTTMKLSVTAPNTAVPALINSSNSDPPDLLNVSVIRCCRWNRSLSRPMVEE